MAVVVIMHLLISGLGISKGLCVCVCVCVIGLGFRSTNVHYSCHLPLANTPTHTQIASIHHGMPAGQEKTTQSTTLFLRPCYTHMEQ